jgi:hypothetical protein
MELSWRGNIRGIKMSDIGVVPKLLSVLHSIPLWILVGLAAVGYAALFAPSFGGVDLTEFRRQWGVWCWLDAVTFTILSVACAIDIVLKARMVAARRRRRYEKNRYYHVYAPLFAELMKIHVIIVSGTGAPKLRHRLRNAWIELTTIRRRRTAIKSALKELFDKHMLEQTGEVHSGGAFPIGKIERAVQSNLMSCDDELLNLTGRAVEARREENLGVAELSNEDVQLRKHIIRERDRLKEMLTK